jgi:hypothetical protein
VNGGVAQTLTATIGAGFLGLNWNQQMSMKSKTTKLQATNEIACHISVERHESCVARHIVLFTSTKSLTPGST